MIEKMKFSLLAKMIKKMNFSLLAKRDRPAAQIHICPPGLPC